MELSEGNRRPKFNHYGPSIIILVKDWRQTVDGMVARIDDLFVQWLLEDWRTCVQKILP